MSFGEKFVALARSKAAGLKMMLVRQQRRQDPFPFKDRIRILADTPDISGKRFLFVAGLHRSGTSILHRHLREHDQISGFHDTGVPEDEGQHVQDVIPTARVHGGPGYFAFDPRAHMREDEAKGLSSASRKRLLKQWGAQWDLSRPVLLEKSPPTLNRSRFFQELFPNSAFVFLVRHPIAVCLATEKWSRLPIPTLMRHWARAHELLLEDVPFLKNAMIVRYEDYVRAPAVTLRNICELIHLPPSEPKEEAFDANAPYFQKWESERGQATVRHFGPVAETAAKFGYSEKRPYVDRNWTRVS
jgi:hypothetical protein